MKKDKTMFMLLFILLFIQRTIFGCTYFQTMDDWFLYYGRSLEDNIWETVNLSSRPFAMLADAYIITPLVKHMFVSQIIIMLMLAGSAYFLCRAFKRSNIFFGTAMAVIIVLFPLNFEAVYWIAAAVRIVPSIFFAALSAFLLTIYTDKKKTSCLIFYCIASVFACGFYEFFVPVYLALNLIIIINKKNLRLVAVPIAAAAVTSIYYMINSGDPNISERVSIVKAKDIWEHTVYVYRLYYNLIITEGRSILFKSVRDGFLILKAHPFRLFITAAVSAAVGYFSFNNKEEKRLLYNIIIGVVLIISGFAINLVLGYVRLPFRLLAALVIGGALMVEILFTKLFRGISYKIIVGLMAFVMSASNIGILNIYKNTNESDKSCAEILLKDKKVTDSDYVTFIVNAPLYWYDDYVRDNEFVKAATENYAVITNMAAYISGKTLENNIVTINEVYPIGYTVFNSDYVNMYYMTEKHILKKCIAEPNGDGYIIKCEGHKTGELRLEYGMYKFYNYK